MLHLPSLPACAYPEKASQAHLPAVDPPARPTPCCPPVQILKKHHKRTGQRVRSELLANLLAQPFCSLEASQLMPADAACPALLVASLVLTFAMGARSSTVRARPLLTRRAADLACARRCSWPPCCLLSAGGAWHGAVS
jgi:hypothetical protein